MVGTCTRRSAVILLEAGQAKHPTGKAAEPDTMYLEEHTGGSTKRTAAEIKAVKLQTSKQISGTA